MDSLPSIRTTSRWRSGLIEKPLVLIHPYFSSSPCVPWNKSTIELQHIYVYEDALQRKVTRVDKIYVPTQMFIPTFRCFFIEFNQSPKHKYLQIFDLISFVVSYENLNLKRLVKNLLDVSVCVAIREVIWMAFSEYMPHSTTWYNLQPSPTHPDTEG